MAIPLKSLTQSDFANYGRILDYNPDDQDPFQVVVAEGESHGWRIAMMKVVAQPIAKVACHPNTMEAFEPVSGVCGILVGSYDKPAQLEAFILDRAVCINKSVWHAVFSLSGSALVRVTENAEVESETFELSDILCIGLTGCKG